jgi:FKBP-type peptidyl-prolyl cis-trans isomerase
MRHLSILGLVVISAAFIIFSCNSGAYQKTKSGLVYRIEKKGNGPKLKYGNYIKFHLKVFLKDSLTFNSYGDMPKFSNVDSVGGGYDITEVFPLLHVGDSVLVVQTIDTILKLMGKTSIDNKTIDSVVPGFKKGDKINYHIVILEKYENVAEYQAAMMKESEAMRMKELAEMEVQKPKDIAEIERYLKEKNINATKTSMGTFVEIIKPGQSPLPDSGKLVSVKYTGMNFKGKKFDSNVDSTFGHTDLLEVALGQMRLIQGFEDGLKLVGKGGKARIYIPSALAYGKRGSPPTIEPNENLIFEIEVVDIKQAPKPQPMPNFNDPNKPTTGDTSKSSSGNK